MKKLKSMLLKTEQESGSANPDRVVVLGFSISSCLERAAEHLKAELPMLDYKILEQGSHSLLNAKPYRLEVTVRTDLQGLADLEQLAVKLGVGSRLAEKDIGQEKEVLNVDGKAIVRNYLEGVSLIVEPPKGKGRPVDLQEVLLQIRHNGTFEFNMKSVQKAVKEASGDPIVIAKLASDPDHSSNCRVEITPDQMKAFVKITPPRPRGLHLRVADVIAALRSYGIVNGFKEKEIEQFLLEDRYMESFLAAEAEGPKHGANARIDYKVDLNKNRWHVAEDASGKVDFKNLDLVENVTVGQVLAEKIPPSKGRPGRTLFDNFVPARDGKDIRMRNGKGAILSEDGNRIIAEVNGQAVIKDNRIAVDPVYLIVSDVGPKTGNIDFLGSVVVDGSILDNYEIKAGGTITIGGSIQKAVIQADADVIVRGGIQGGRIHSKEGSVYAKFIQNAIVSAKEKVEAAEGILHSNIEVEGQIFCRGKRAQVTGGQLRAQKGIRAKIIGSQAHTTTEINVGTDPSLLAEYEEVQNSLKENKKKLDDIHKAIITLQSRKKSTPSSFDKAHEELLQENLSLIQSLKNDEKGYKQKNDDLEQLLQTSAIEGKVHAEKQIMPGVNISIRDAHLNISESYQQVTFSYEKGRIKINKLEKDELPHSTYRNWRRPQMRR